MFIKNGQELCLILKFELQQSPQIVLVLDAVFEENFVLNLGLMELELLLGAMGEDRAWRGLRCLVASLLKKKESSWHHHVLVQFLRVVDDLLFTELVLGCVASIELHLAKLFAEGD